MLEALGLTVMEEVPTRLDGGDDGAYLHDFGVLVDDAQLDCERDGERLAEAITAVWSGRCESDTLNALVVRAGLRVRRRRDPARLPPLPAHRRADVHRRVPERRARAPTRRRRGSLVELFRARFCEPADEAREAELRARARRAARRPCGSLDEDRILRGFAALIDATVRTNAALGRPYLSFKLRSARRAADAARRRRSSRSSSTTRWSRASTCAAGTWRAAASAGRTAARTTAPRCSG